MISPPLLPVERRYEIVFYLALAVIAGVLLSGCGPDGNPPEPRSVCTQVTGIYGCG